MELLLFFSFFLLSFFYFLSFCNDHVFPFKTGIKDWAFSDRQEQVLNLSEEFKSFALSRLRCYFGVFFSLALFRASTAGATWSFLPFLSWDSPTLFWGPGSMLSAVFLLGSSGRAGMQKLKDFSWSWVWQVCCLHSDHLCLFEVVLVKADGNYQEAWGPPPLNPHCNWTWP